MNVMLQTKIEQQIQNNRIMIYMKGNPQMPQCGFSAAVVQVFDSLGHPYATEDVLQDGELRQGIKEFSNWPTIPQVYVNGEFIGGCDIVMELHQKGELSSLLAETPAS
ncbi:MAG: Grx4 family monothiol glutaredoxin [Oscillatoriales cyanobacterium SM2_2_1]|nr:Grx4 family monothiol glutaredoxin [Oscillatoriales cyanobacterium SM2_2_1]